MSHWSKSNNWDSDSESHNFSDENDSESYFSNVSSGGSEEKDSNEDDSNEIESSDEDSDDNNEQIVLLLHIPLKRDEEHMIIPCRVKYTNRHFVELSRKINFEDILPYIQQWTEDRYDDWDVDINRDIIEIKEYVATKRGKVDILFED